MTSLIGKSKTGQPKNLNVKLHIHGLRVHNKFYSVSFLNIPDIQRSPNF